MFHCPIFQVERAIKGLLFDCRGCGQCVLQKTALVCPMSCPKGLRNGPCGGTMDGRCEVKPDQPCVWVRIHEGRGTDHGAPPPLLPSVDASLLNTSSILNRLTDKDAATRDPLPWLQLPSPRVRQPLQTASALEHALKSGRFVHTCELRSPRHPDFAKFDEEMNTLSKRFDAVNVTSFLRGQPSVPSSVGAGRLAAAGFDAVSQATARDHTRTTFVAELVQCHLLGIHNMLCLTGDATPREAGKPTPRAVFDMDSSLMIYEARHLREKGTVAATGQKMTPVPRVFLGAAINPLSSPVEVPLRRLHQKIAAGVDFIQTQAIFDLDGLERFMAGVVERGLHHDVFTLIGIPVVTSKRVLDHLSGVPGLRLTEEARRRLADADDIVAAGVALARESIARVQQMPGAHGVHLMLFGPNPAVLNDLLPDEPAIEESLATELASPVALC